MKSKHFWEIGGLLDYWITSSRPTNLTKITGKLEIFVSLTLSRTSAVGKVAEI